MLVKHLIAALVIVTFMAGCATANEKPEDYSCKRILINPSCGGGSESFDCFLFLLTIDAALYGGCRGIAYLGDILRPANISDGIYRSEDGLFRVAVPGSPTKYGQPGVDIRESISPQHDYVFFTPATQDGAIYGISIMPQLQPPYDSMSLDEFAKTPFLSDTQFRKDDATSAQMKRIHVENATLGGEPALFEVYSRPLTIDASGIAGGKSVYYLMYFIKTKNRAAILSVTWPRECPQCLNGSEADIRAMDPNLKQFVESFHLADSGSSRH